MKFQNIAADVKLGTNVKIFDFVNIYGCLIGDNTKVSVFVEIQRGAKIGRNCKISSHTFTCEGVPTTEDSVFIGHNVTFINDTYPLATTADGDANRRRLEYIPTLIQKGASIGSSTTLLCGITVGKNAIVGPVSVVTKDVPSNTIVAGNPVRLFRKIEGE